MTRASATDPRRTARTVTLQWLFATDLTQGSQEGSLEWLAEDNPLSSRALKFAQELVAGVKENLPELDRVIHRYAPAWPVDQLSAVDRNVLRIALFELLFHTETPRKSAVNEAVELAKVFGSESSARFTNGVLGSIISDLESGALVVNQPVCGGR